MNPCESPASSPAPQEEKKTRQHWPIEVKKGSVTAKIYPSKRRRPDGSPRFYYVAYYLPSGREVKQRGTLEKAREHARLMVDSIAAGEVDAAEMSKHDRLELLALRERAQKFGMTSMMAMDEWVRIRELVGSDGITAAERWKTRLTQYERVSVKEAVTRYKTSFVADRLSEAKGLSEEAAEKKILPKSYQHALQEFSDKFAERFLDDLKKPELQKWFQSKGAGSGWTANTYRKRVVTLFRWARKEGLLPRDQLTEAELTSRSKEKAPKREIISPATLARILFLLKEGIDLKDLTRKFDPRPEFIPAVVASAFAGYRSCEGDLQVWEDFDMSERQGAVTKAKEGTKADRATTLPECAIAWLELTPEAERTGPINPWKTEIQTMIRNHLVRTIGLRLPANTFRKSWESYRYVLSHDEGATVADEAGHNTGTQVKHYRNPRAKRSAGELWFEVTPDAFMRNVYIIQFAKESGVVSGEELAAAFTKRRRKKKRAA